MNRCGALLRAQLFSPGPHHPGGGGAFVAVTLEVRHGGPEGVAKQRAHPALCDAKAVLRVWPWKHLETSANSGEDAETVRQSSTRHGRLSILERPLPLFLSA